MLRSALVLALLATATVHAEGDGPGPYEAKIRRNVGVGLGTRIFGHVGDGLAFQILAATTNGSFGNQTFAISSGTLGADQPNRIARLELNDYLRKNMDNVARDIAAGAGESLEAILDILAVPNRLRPSVASRMQSKFAAIYAEKTVTSDVVADRLMVLAQPA